MAERDVIKPVTRWAKKRGVKWLRITLMPGAERGWPDHVFLVPGGAPVMFEFKKPGEGPSEIQKVRLEYLHENGYAAFCVDDGGEAIDILEKHRAAGLERLRQKPAR